MPVLTIFDIINLIIIFGSLLQGLFNGFIKSVLNFCTFILAIYVTYLSYPIAQNVLKSYISNDTILVISSLVTAYVIVAIIIGLANNKILDIIKPVRGGIFDRFLGIVFGVLKGSLVVTIIFIIAAILTSGSYKEANNLYDLKNETTPKKYPDWLKNSSSAEFIGPVIEDALSNFSDDELKSISVKMPKNLPSNKKSNNSGYVEDLETELLELKKNN